MSHRPTISLSLCALLLSAVLLPAGQAASGSPPKTASAAKGAAPAQKPDKKTDVCALLTRAEIQVVQSEPVEEIIPSAQPSGGFVLSLCFYRTTTKSVSLGVAAPDPAKPSAFTPREFWGKQFHPPEPMGEEKPVAGKAPKKAEVEREGESRKPLVIDGLGEEAYWVGNRITGALYVLQGDAFLRISIGGGEDESVRIKKAKALAEKALKRVDALPTLPADRNPASAGLGGASAREQ
jgi:hypothetical protein